MSYLLVTKRECRTRMLVNSKFEATAIPTLESDFQYHDKVKWFSLLNLKQAFLQIPLDEIKKNPPLLYAPSANSNVILPIGNGQWWPCTHTSYWQNFRGIIYKYLFSFFNVTWTYSNESFKDNLQKDKTILGRLQNAGLTVNPEK